MVASDATGPVILQISVFRRLQGGGDVDVDTQTSGVGCMLWGTHVLADRKTDTPTIDLNDGWPATRGKPVGLTATQIQLAIYDCGPATLYGNYRDVGAARLAADRRAHKR
jgi:hypothetical protein